MISLVQDEWVISVVFLHGLHFKNLHFCILWFVLDCTFANSTITIQVYPSIFLGVVLALRSGVHNLIWKSIPTFNSKPIPTCWKETSIVIVSCNFFVEIHGCTFVVTSNVIPSYQVSTLIYHIRVPNSRFPYQNKSCSSCPYYTYWISRHKGQNDIMRLYINVIIPLGCYKYKWPSYYSFLHKQIMSHFGMATILTRL
jgi:hypothetical protein